jgi:hypothetical protein
MESRTDLNTFATLCVHLPASPEAAKSDLVNLVDVLSGLGCTRLDKGRHGGRRSED